jgi:hypothetical protein
VNNVLDTPEGRQFAASINWEPGRAELRIEGRTACDCGCGKPNRVDVTLDGRTVSIISPDAVDLVITTLQRVRRKLWGEP